MSTYKHSQACCAIPPIVTSGYEAKGSYIDIQGMKTYVTGPTDAKEAILVFYDVFGHGDQIIQGMDIMASADKEHGYLVISPAWFGDNPAPMELFPVETDEQKAKFGEWLVNAAPPKHLPKVQPVMAEIKEKYPSITTWGMMGYCWGGKMVSLIAGKSTAFKAGVQSSPAMVSPDDAKAVQIPMCVLASKEEPADDIAAYDASLTVPKHVETFDTEFHGWMSARADFSNPTSKKEYVRGYTIAIEFFQQHL